MSKITILDGKKEILSLSIEDDGNIMDSLKTEVQKFAAFLMPGIFMAQIENKGVTSSVFTEITHNCISIIK